MSKGRRCRACKGPLGHNSQYRTECKSCVEEAEVLIAKQTAVAESEAAKFDDMSAAFRKSLGERCG